MISISTTKAGEGSNTKELLEYGPVVAILLARTRSMWGHKVKLWRLLRENVLGCQWSYHKRCFSSSVWDRVRAHRGNGSLIIENFRHMKNGAVGYDTLQENVEIFSRNLAFHIDAKQSSSTMKKTKIAFLCKPSITYIVSLLSIWKLNAVAIPLSPSHPYSEVEHVLNDSGADIVLYEDDLKALWTQQMHLIWMITYHSIVLWAPQLGGQSGQEEL